jgi:hypothetical protein
MAEPCGDCLNAGELGDEKTWICLQYSGNLANGQLYIQLIDENTDWEKCEKYISPTDVEGLAKDDEEEEEEDE